MLTSFLRVFVVAGLLLAPGSAGQQTPRPPRDDKHCNCEAKFKTCKKFAKSKPAKKVCDDDRRDCLNDCKTQGVGV